MDKKIKDLLDEFYTDTWKPVPVIEYLPEETLISKKYQFIERLVKNDKIDMSKLDSRYSKVEYEPLLMLLAIQDEPIDFLLSILK